MDRSKGRHTGAGEVLTIDELAAYLKIAKSTLYKLSQEGRIPAQKVGRHWRFRKDAIDRWLEEPGSRTGSRGEVSMKLEDPQPNAVARGVLHDLARQLRSEQ